MSDKRPDPRSGLDERGEWTPAFPGQRRPVGPEDGVETRFAPGNELSLKHGAESPRRLGPLQAEILEQLRAIAPLDDPADRPALEILAGRIAKIRLLQAWVDEHGTLDERGVPRPATKQLERLENGAVAMLRELGMTTMAREQIADLVRAHRNLVPAVAVQAYVSRLALGADDLLQSVLAEHLSRSKAQAVLRAFRDGFGHVLQLAAVEAPGELVAGRAVDVVEGDGEVVDG